MGNKHKHRDRRDHRSHMKSREHERNGAVNVPDKKAFAGAPKDKPEEKKAEEPKKIEAPPSPAAKITVVKIEDHALEKIMHWVHKSNFEVSGLGMVEIRDGVPFVTDVVLIEQEVTASETEMSPAAVNKAMYELRKAPGDLRFWWHSHVDMDVFWSYTDKQTIRALGEHGWFISTVFNKKQEMRTAVYLKDPFPIFFDEVTTEVQEYMAVDLMKQLDDDYDKKVKKKEYGYSGGGHYGSGWHGHLYDYASGHAIDDDDDDGWVQRADKTWVKKSSLADEEDSVVDDTEEEVSSDDPDLKYLLSLCEEHEEQTIIELVQAGMSELEIEDYLLRRRKSGAV